MEFFLWQSYGNKAKLMPKLLKQNKNCTKIMI